MIQNDSKRFKMIQNDPKINAKTIDRFSLQNVRLMTMTINRKTT